MIGTPSRSRQPPGVVVLALAAFMAASACSGSGGDSGGEPLEDFNGRFAVGFRTERFVDASRPTSAGSNSPATPDRTLVTTIFYPASGTPALKAGEDAAPATKDGPFPLVLFSHGGGTMGTSYSNLLTRVAAAGFVVAAPNYIPARGGDDPGTRPADARFVITSVLDSSADRSSPVNNLIDRERIGAMGHSAGGGITLGFAHNACCLDSRVRASVLLASVRPNYPGEAFPAPGVPTLVVHGDADTRASYAEGRQLFADLRPPKYFVTVLGAEHTPPFSGEMQRPEAKLVVDAIVAFLDLHLKGDAGGRDRLRRVVENPPGIATLESGATG